MPKTLNKDGSVSDYGLACGHIQRVAGHSVRIDLHQEHGTYFVKVVIDGQKILYEGFRSLTRARLFFAQAKKNYRL